MPDLAVVLKSEIRRLARKECRSIVSGVQKRAARHRRDIAALKRLIDAQAKKIVTLERLRQRQSVAAVGPKEDARYSARSVKAQRKRLKLSAQAFAKLIGVTGQTVYAWEQKQSKPRKTQMQAFLEVRALSVQEAQDRLGRAKKTRKGR